MSFSKVYVNNDKARSNHMFRTDSAFQDCFPKFLTFSMAVSLAASRRCCFATRVGAPTILGHAS